MNHRDIKRAKGTPQEKMALVVREYVRTWGRYTVETASGELRFTNIEGARLYMNLYRIAEHVMPKLFDSAQWTPTPGHVGRQVAGDAARSALYRGSRIGGILSNGFRASTSGDSY